ncbi:MAG: hypothetical protein AAB676_08850, partial [Verrucomicrobiota bacterium]
MFNMGVTSVTGLKSRGGGTADFIEFEWSDPEAGESGNLNLYLATHLAATVYARGAVQPQRTQRTQRKAGTSENRR